MRIVIRTVLFAALLGATMPARAADPPCPRFYTCAMVRLAVAKYGAGTVESHVRACGWSETRITEARKCLR